MTNKSISTDQEHSEKMARRKLARDKIMASKTIERGLLIVHTGSGKGKSTAAFGMALRAIGHGQRLAIVQFVKGAWHSGEKTVFEKFPEQVTIRAMGEGFTWETQDRQRDITAAQKAWQAAVEFIHDNQIKLLILDELNIVLRYDYLPLEVIIETLRARRSDLTVVITGRNAKPELIEAADLVTEMTLIKHPFKSGVKAQAGIEY